MNNIFVWTATLTFTFLGVTTCMPPHRNPTASAVSAVVMGALAAFGWITILH